MKKLLFLSLFFTCNLFSQEIKVKIIDIKAIDYYYVYKAVNYNLNDTITLLGSKVNSEEAKLVLLNTDECYKLKTRLKSAIKISPDKYFFCKPNITIIENVQISDESSLPILILEYENDFNCNK